MKQIYRALFVSILSSFIVHGSVAYASESVNVLVTNSYSANSQNSMKSTLSPNPAQDQVKLSTQQNYSRFEVVSTTGKVVKRFSTSSDHSYDLSGLPKGLYLVVLYDDQKQLEVIKLFIK